MYALIYAQQIRVASTVQVIQKIQKIQIYNMYISAKKQHVQYGV